jgi:hypothetical protein
MALTPVRPKKKMILVISATLKVKLPRKVLANKWSAKRKTKNLVKITPKPAKLVTAPLSQAVLLNQITVVVMETPEELVTQLLTNASSAHELKPTLIAHKLKVNHHPTVTLEQLQRTETTVLHQNVSRVPQVSLLTQIVTNVAPPGRCVMPWSLEPAHLFLVLLRLQRPTAQRWYVIPILTFARNVPPRLQAWQIISALQKMQSPVLGTPAALTACVCSRPEMKDSVVVALRES